MSFFANILEKTKRELSREPRGGSSGGKRRIVAGCVLVVVTFVFLIGTDEPSLWLVNLALAMYFVLLGAAALLYESRRTLAVLLRLASLPFAVTCFVLFVAYVFERR